MLLRAAVVLIILKSISSQECKLNKNNGEILVQGKLKSHLKSCSPLTQPPVNSEFTVYVQVILFVQTFNLDFYEDAISLHGWSDLTWNDYRLTWKPAEFSNLNMTFLSSKNIWTPGLRLVNNAEMFDFDIASFSSNECVLNSTGAVECPMQSKHKIFCTSKLSNWPYDTKTCTLKFGQWRMSEAKLIFTLKMLSYFKDSTKNNGWQILRDSVSQNESGPVTVKFDLERLAEGLEATIVMPCFVVAVLTVAALLLDYKKDVRLGILSLSLISHFLFLNEISINIPKFSKDVPVILLFIGQSTILTVILFVISLGFKFIGKLTNQPVAWVSAISDFILKSRGRYAIVTWEGGKNYHEPKDWIDVVNITNSICLFIVVVVYICLFASYMPVKVPRDEVKIDRFYDFD